jgi:hypothetical protein
MDDAEEEVSDMEKDVGNMAFVQKGRKPDPNGADNGNKCLKDENDNTKTCQVKGD